MPLLTTTGIYTRLSGDPNQWKNGMNYFSFIKKQTMISFAEKERKYGLVIFTIYFRTNSLSVPM